MLFDAFVKTISGIYPEMVIKVQKSQIAFCGEKPFCWVWLPIRSGIKGRPAHYIILSFGLNREISHPRLVGTTEAYPGRWTHHAIISRMEEIDEVLLRWIDEAYDWKNPRGAKG